ncbi:hypothetical protein [Vreelandella subglaciescola]|jgi:hypothetical protein|uniref:Uncharacterized protein n=1 Tax=Vreelandella subglaciescola TaxID=29571 RepID=A0A1M7G077_9GAMM|nr:hypothetical protein [Halomonas subglaciescola]SHM09299.1 hypothetical protein SAMN05878437_1180 [Halomonas subglaciescola]
MPNQASSSPSGTGAFLLRATLYFLATGAMAQGAYLEVLYLPVLRFSEMGFTELAQTLLLISACSILLYVRLVLKVWPHVTLLLLAFLTASLIREQDSFLDDYVAEHAWKVLVAIVILPSITWVAIHRRRFAAELAEYSQTFSLGLFTAGFFTTYAFSRLYGRKEFWQAIMQEHYRDRIKSMAEEVVELLGYSLILFAMIELLLLARRMHLARQQQGQR